MRISDWSSDVCSSDLKGTGKEQQIKIQASGGLNDADIDQMVKDAEQFAEEDKKRREAAEAKNNAESLIHSTERQLEEHGDKVDAALKSEIEAAVAEAKTAVEGGNPAAMTEKRSEEHTSELQSLMRISYAVICLTKQNRRH